YGALVLATKSASTSRASRPSRQADAASTASVSASSSTPATTRMPLARPPQAFATSARSSRRRGKYVASRVMPIMRPPTLVHAPRAVPARGASLTEVLQREAERRARDLHEPGERVIELDDQVDRRGDRERRDEEHRHDRAVRRREEPE